jgi:hypothetical protein
MIECVFTLDYEIYGNGTGSLDALVREPAERLSEAFRRHDARFDVFVEVAELQRIESEGTDPGIGRVRDQLRALHREGFEIGLHLHPQWFNGRFEDGRWHLDYAEYNLCALQKERIVEIVDRSIAYLRGVLDEPDFVPLSFRAGNWLFQPARTAAEVLAERGVKVDSSVFKGGLRHDQGLDYRKALGNGYYWRFREDAGIRNPDGTLIELPIYAQMVPFWRLLSARRFDLERRGSSGQTGRQRMSRIRDLLRFRHPLKFDFCRMTAGEMTRMLDIEVREDRRDPSAFRPIVAIGHTKELSGTGAVDAVLSFLSRHGVAVSTFWEVSKRCA